MYSKVYIIQLFSLNSLKLIIQVLSMLHKNNLKQHSCFSGIKSFQLLNVVYNLLQTPEIDFTFSISLLACLP